MLLEELLRNTTSSHPDYAPLKKAAEDMLTRAAEMNERVSRFARVTVHGSISIVMHRSNIISVPMSFLI